NGVPYLEVTNAAGTQRSAAAAPIAAGAWHHLTVTAGTDLQLYLDGNPYASLAAQLPALASPATLGGEAPPAAGAAAPTRTAPAPPQEPPPAGTNFVGELDELEIAKIARPAGFIKAMAIGEGGELAAKFLNIGNDEETASWLSGYFAIILKSVTLDGWVVIGL